MYLETKHDWRPSTRETALKHLTYFLEFANGEDVTIQDFEEWHRDHSDSYRYNSLLFVKGFLDWQGIESPLMGHTIKRGAPPMQPYIVLKDYLKLVEACDLSTTKGVRDACILVLLWETWCRASSLTNCMVHHVDLKNQEIHFHDAKAGKNYSSGYGPDLSEALELWNPIRATIAKCDSLFVNLSGSAFTYHGLRELFNSLYKRTGIRTSAHCFRRGGARHHASEGGNDRQGMEQGGWETYKMYQRYTRGVSLDKFKKKSFKNGGES